MPRRSVQPEVEPTGGMAVPAPEFRADAKEHICERLMLGERLEDICRVDDLPPRATVMRWMTKDPGFRAAMDDALRSRALLESNRILDIADGKDGAIVVTSEDGDEVAIPEDTQRSRLRVDTRFRLLKHLEPAVWGDKQVHEHDVGGDLAELMAGAVNQGHRLPSERVVSEQ